MSGNGSGRTGRARALWIALLVLCALSVGADFLVEHHSHFGIEATPGFAAWYGVLACLLLILLAGVAGVLLKRRDDYYD